MSKIGLAILLILMAGRNYAQQDYFVLIQADNNQPFYARMGGKLFSSSAQGHLILSQLKEGSYSIAIGFPRQSGGEQQFSIGIHNKDLEFQLKDLEEKGWGLFNPQTLELKMPEEKKDTELKNHLEGVKKDDAFSRLMAGVVSDTAVMYNTYTVEATQKDSPAVLKSAADITQSTVVMRGIAPSDSSVKDTAAAITNSPTGAGAPKEVTRTDTVIRMETPSRLDTGALVVRADTIQNKAIPGTGALNLADTAKIIHPDKPGSIDSAMSITKRGDSVIIDLTVHKSDSLAVGGFTPAVSESASPAPQSTPAIVPSLPKAGSVVKLSERKTTKGVRLVYADHSKVGKADTIVVIIPVDTVNHLAQRSAGSGSAISGATASDIPALNPARADHPLTARKEEDVPGQKTPSAGTVTVRPDSVQKKAPVRSLFINSDCRNFATEYDVDKLRVKMLEAGKEDDRITAAHKVFKTKCFSTRQVKALSEVFTSDAQKFRFLEAAYPFVSDDHFKELAELLTDPVYNSKFKTMTGQ